MSTANINILSANLDPIAEEMTPQLAWRIVGIEVRPDLAARVEGLGRKANQGTLTDEEHVE